MVSYLLLRTRLRLWDYDRACDLWLRWHRYVCQPLAFHNYLTATREASERGVSYKPITMRRSRFMQWLHRLNVQYVCGPLDDWAHSREEIDG